MPILKYWMNGERPVVDWLETHPQQIAISTFTLAEIRRGIELKPASKARRELERKFRFVVEDYEGCIWVFDEAAAIEWGKLMAEARNQPIPFDDSLIGAIARSMGAKMLTRNIRHFPGCITIDPWTGLEHPAWHPR